MKLSNVILASLIVASLSGVAQDEKPIGCGKTRPKENIKHIQDPVVKSDSLQKEPIKKPERQCGKCGRG
jgi:hypothetical protein